MYNYETRNTLLAPLKQAAQMFDVTLRYIWSLVAKKHIKSIADRNDVYVNTGELEAYFATHKTERNKNRVQHKKRLRAK